MTRGPWAWLCDILVLVPYLHWVSHPSPGPHVLGILWVCGRVPPYII